MAPLKPQLNPKIKIIALLFASTISLTIYFLPIHEEPPILPDAKWRYYYREIFISNGKIIYEVNEILKYSAINITRNILVVEVNRTFQWKYFSENATEIISTNGTDTSLSFVNIKNRMYSDGTYTSWWIPTNIFTGKLVPIWTMDFYVKCLSWIVVNGKLIECWVLEYKNAVEEYTLLYERTTGFFILFNIKVSTGSSQQLLIERRLIDTDVRWPALTIIRPFLALTGFASLASLVYLCTKKIRRYLRMPKRETAPFTHPV